MKKNYLKTAIEKHTEEGIEEIFLEIAWNVYYAITFLEALMEIEKVKK